MTSASRSLAPLPNACACDSVCAWLSDSSDKLYFTRTSRDLHKVDVCVASPDTGDVKVLLEERLNTYIETKPLRLANNGQDLIFWSERTGWGHYYLYDANTGALKNALTSGEFVTTSLDAIDDKAKALYITAVGREPNEDPYYPHLYRVAYDGASIKLPGAISGRMLPAALVCTSTSQPSACKVSSGSFMPVTSPVS